MSITDKIKQLPNGETLTIANSDCPLWLRVTDLKALVSELETAKRASEKHFRWAYALLVELAVVKLAETNTNREAPNNWPCGQEWDDINGSSRSIFLGMARKQAGIDNDDFLATVRSGEFDVDDLYERKHIAQAALKSE